MGMCTQGDEDFVAHGSKMLNTYVEGRLRRQRGGGLERMLSLAIRFPRGLWWPMENRIRDGRLDCRGSRHRHALTVPTMFGLPRPRQTTLGRWW